MGGRRFCRCGFAFAPAFGRVEASSTRVLLAGLKPCPTVTWLGLDFVAVWVRMPAAEAGWGLGQGLESPCSFLKARAKAKAELVVERFVR